jgi:dTDP-4-dehydrorhamnose 3,5-epimerase
MHLTQTQLPEVLVMEPTVHGDHRGFFMETFRSSVFSAAGLPEIFVQDNHSRSTQGTLRGLHYQIKNAQGKLVRVVAGEIFDVAVDLRRSSPNFGKWVGITLSAENKKSLWIPPGFGHGFLVTSPIAEVTYKCTTYYAPEYDRNVLWSDPDINIAWPRAGEILLSEKDRLAPLLKYAEVYG